MSERKKRYYIRLRGFVGNNVVATSAGKARAQTYRSFCDARKRIPFLEFLSMIETFHHLGSAGLSEPST